MKTIKKICYVIVGIFILFLFLSYYDLTIYASSASSMEYFGKLSEMSEDECMSFIAQNNISIPKSLDDKESVKKFVKSTIETIESNPNYEFMYNFHDTQNFVNAIKDLVNNYYKINEVSKVVSSQSIESSYYLKNSCVYSNGEWKSSGGDWNPKWKNYNCYAYSIKRSEYPAQYDSGVYINYQPGDFSKTGSFYSTISIENLAKIVKSDLETLGMNNIEILDDIPTDLSKNEKLICVRKCFVDYHFMRYDSSSSSWYHKPGPSAVLKYNYLPSNDLEWTNEHSYYGKEYAGDTTYNSDIKFIVYSMPTINLSCKSISSSDVRTIESGHDIIYEVNIKCAKSYKFISLSTSSINVTFYNNDMDIIPSIIPVMSNNNSTATTTTYLNPGTYYLRLNFTDSNYSGNITTEYQATYPVNDTYQVNIGENSLPTHSHFEDNYNYNLQTYFINTYDAAFYKFKLTAGNITSYPSGAIKVYKDQSRTELLDRFETDMISYSASSNTNENEIYVYLPCNGTYYIDISLNSINYSSVTMEIEEVELNELNYSSTLSSPAFNVVFENINKYSYFEKVIIDASSKIQIDVIARGTLNDYVPILLFKEEVDYDTPVNNREYYLDTVFIGEVNPIEYIPCYTFILEPGTYYIGYIDNTDKVFMNIAFTRLVEYSDNMDSILVADPYYTGYDLGTEVLFNKGACNTYTITEGFTRNIYLMVEDRLRDPMSRLEYEWYSSNESVATVSSYGTVLARQVEIDTTVKIFAVLKEDPSIVYFKEFTILNDEEEELIEIELDMSYSYSEQNGTYQLELNNTNCPYPMIQYYDFEVYEWVQEGEFDVSLNYWGQVTATGPGACVIIGTYKLNPRVKLIINLNII